MNILEKIKKDIAKQVNQVLKTAAVTESDLVFPPDAKMGDLSLPCFGLSKELKKSPVEVAGELSGKLKTGGLIETVTAVGPYLNFRLGKSALAKKLFAQIEKEGKGFGENKSGKKKRVMIEYSNVNTHKEYHIGHLRNITYGDAVNRIIAANGYDSIPVSYINDFGIHVAKTLWWLYHKDNKEAQAFLASGDAKKRGEFLGRMYVEATKKMEELENAKEAVSQIMKQIEGRKGDYYKLWRETRKWSIEQFAQIYRELKIEFRDTFYESEVIDDGFKMVAELYEKRILTKSQGVIIADLEKYGLGVLVFLRSDGTALYPVADLPLFVLKFKKYKLFKSIVVVDIRQGLHFKQLFKVLEFLGYKQEKVHLGHDVVKLPEGMMSSRLGNVIKYEDLRDKMIDYASVETKKRHEDWRDDKIMSVAKKLAFGAMKFEMIKVSREKAITFDIHKALQFEGYTAAYLQYVYARISSILRKSGLKAQELTLSRKAEFVEPKEHDLIMKLAKYPDIVKQAGENYEPSEIAKYLFELAQLFNDFYHDVPVLKAPEETKLARLALVSAVRQIVVNGFELLGIETMEEM